MTGIPPSITVCLDLMEEYGMLPNIRDHSFVVARAAERIHDRLGDSPAGDHLPDRELVTAGALLHDIAKTGCLQTGCDHARMGGEICEQAGFSEVAEIVREHVRLRSYETERYRQGIFKAKEIIFYADKRVVHDRIVSLEERLEYILERYGNNDPVRHGVIRRNFENCQIMERHLCRTTGHGPAELLEDLSIAPYRRCRP